MLFFHSVENLIIPTDELIFFRGVGIPPARIDVKGYGAGSKHTTVLSISMG